MALYVFNSIVADPNASIPVILNITLNNNGVNLTGIGPNVKAVLFNKETTLTGTTADISLDANNTAALLTIDTAYNGKIIAVEYNDNLSYTFTLNTGVFNQAGTLNGFNSVSYEKLRKWNMGYGGDIGRNINTENLILFSILHP